MSQPHLDALARTLRELALSFVRESPRGSLSRTAAGTLSVLDGGGPRRITELADVEVVSQPAMTGLVQRMEAASLVERRSDPDDRRACLIALTDAGRAALHTRRRQQDAVIAARLERLDPTDRAALEAAAPSLNALIDTTEDHELV